MAAVLRAQIYSVSWKKADWWNRLPTQLSHFQWHFFCIRLLSAHISSLSGCRLPIWSYLFYTDVVVIVRPLIWPTQVSRIFFFHVHSNRNPYPLTSTSFMELLHNWSLSLKHLSKYLVAIAMHNVRSTGGTRKRVLMMNSVRQFD